MKTLKIQIVHTNVKYNKFGTIVNLGEAKSYIDFLRELEPKEGAIIEGYENRTSIYKTQLSFSEKNILIEQHQKYINELTDELDEFNAKTDLIDLPETNETGICNS